MYELTIEPRTAFGQRVADGRLVPYDEDTLADTYVAAHELLASLGFEHYEISSYARPGHRAVHNGLYWAGAEYVGVGVGAASFHLASDGSGERRTNTTGVAAYLGGASAAPSIERSTAPEELSLDRVRRNRNLRRIYIAGLCLFLLAGVTSLLCVHTRDTSASGDGYTLTVHYADRTRPGLATPWSVEVRKPGGFDGPVSLATTAGYFDLFDENGLDPEPTSSITSGEFLVWEFDPPELRNVR